MHPLSPPDALDAAYRQLEADFRRLQLLHSRLRLLRAQRLRIGSDLHKEYEQLQKAIRKAALAYATQAGAVVHALRDVHVEEHTRPLSLPVPLSPSPHARPLGRGA